MKELDDIAEEAARNIQEGHGGKGVHPAELRIVRSAIDKAIEFVLTRDRAMQAALLEELRRP